MTIFSYVGLLLLFGAGSVSAAAEPVAVGFELHGNVVFLKASIGGSEPLEMALDSGSTRTTLDEAVAGRLGFDLSMKALSSGAMGKQEISVLKGLTLRLAGLEVEEPLVVAYPLDFLSERLGRQVDGIIGIELFHKYVIELDYPNHEIRILPPDGFSYEGSGEVVPVTYAGRLPIVPGSVTPFGGERILARFQVDTGGARAGAMLWKAFLERHGVVAGARDVTEVPVTRFGGTTPEKQGRIQAMEVGTLTVDEPIVGLNGYQYGDPAVFDGNLGSGFLKEFKVVFDLPHNRMILERPAGE